MNVCMHVLVSESCVRCVYRVKKEKKVSLFGFKYLMCKIQVGVVKIVVLHVCRRMGCVVFRLARYVVSCGLCS